MIYKIININNFEIYKININLNNDKNIYFNLFKYINQNDCVYFVHSFYAKDCEKNVIAIINKSDLGISDESRKLAESFDYSVNISAESGEGFEKLSELIENIYIDKDLDTGNDAIISNARQAAAVIEALELAKSAIENDLPLEICCSEIEHCMSALGSLDGRTVSEDIVSKIFSSFCVGK